MVVSFSGGNEGEEIYTYPMPCGLQKTRMKYEQGTEETSLGANETDSLDARGDCKHTMDAQMEKEMATHSSVLAWRIPWTETGGLPSVGSHRADMTEVT